MKKNYFFSKFILFSLMLTLSGFLSAQITVTLGSGTTAHANTDAGPINQFYRSLHSQTVYTAAELNTAGVNGGAMTKLGFYIVSGVTNPLPNYTIKIKHTTSANAAVYDGVGLSTFYNTASYNPPAGGFDMLTLSTPFVWNGVDNILVDICFDQVSAYTSTGVVRVYSGAVTNGYIYIRDDSAPQCGIACNTILNSKPQIQFEFLPPAPLDLGVSTLLKPLGSKKCYDIDTIVARVKNFGSAVADFSVTPTIITVNTTGPNAGTYTLALNSGTLATNSTQDYTISTNYNLSNIGTYKLKAYTTVTGDGSALNDTTSLTITRSPLFTTSVLPNDSVCLGVPVQLSANFSSTKQLGTGTLENTNTSYPTPYGNFYKGARHQFLFLASELTAAGLTAGNVTSLAFNVTNLNAAGPFLNFNIAIATTTLTAMTAFQTTGFTNYFASASYAPTLGINTHTLSTPYVWDGVSNIIIESCYNNNPLAYTYNVSVMQSTTPFTSTAWYNSDTDPTLCTSSTSFNSMAQRPNITFEQPATMTFSWSPAIELSSSTISNPIANVTSTRTYTIAGTTSGCMTYDTVQIFVKPTPTPNLGNDSLYCNLPVILFANTAASSYLWNNGSIGSNLNVTTPGKYWVRGTNPNGCSNTDTVMVSLGASPIVTLGSDTAYCQGSTVNLYAGFVAGNTYLWSTGSTASSIAVGATGTYSVVVTNTIGCKSSDTINVISKPKPTVSLVFTGPTTFCVADATVKILFDGAPTGGTYVGAAVTSNSFTASQAGQGSHIIIYNYTGPNGCSNIAKDTLTVNACVGVEELNDNIGFNVYPNPSTGVFTIDVNASSEIKGNITITSIDGKVVLIDAIEGNGLITKSINISNLSNGIYYLKLETKDAIKTYKVLKQ